MTPQLTHLETIDKTLPGLKGRLFDWIVDMSQIQFDQLFEEILGLHSFRQKYNGVLVTDETEVLKPLLAYLPKAEFQITVGVHHYNRICFYRWLSFVDEIILTAVCDELELVLDDVIENANACVLGYVAPDWKNDVRWWRIQCAPVQHLPGIVSMIIACREKATVEA